MSKNKIDSTDFMKKVLEIELKLVFIIIIISIIWVTIGFLTLNRNVKEIWSQKDYIKNENLKHE